MKIALSQTIFAYMVTNHRGSLFRLVASLGPDGWTQTRRNKSVDALRKSFTFHLAGYQHLGIIVYQWC